MSRLKDIMGEEVFIGYPTHLENSGGLLKLCLQQNLRLCKLVEKYLQDCGKSFQNIQWIPKRQDLKLGEICVGRLDEHQYYRVQVLEVLPSDMVTVSVMDYGNIQTLPLSDIRTLHHEMHKAILNIPVLAEACYIDHVFVNKPWSQHELGMLKKLVLYEERRCYTRNLGAGIKVVDIVIGSGKKLTDIILDNFLGIRITDEILVDAVKRNKQLILDHRMLGQSLNQRLVGHDPALYESYLSSDRTSQYSSSSHMLPVGTNHNAYITHVQDGPYLFSLQLKSSAEDSLPRMTRLLKQREPVVNSRPLLPGMMVMTILKDDNSYRRSILVEIRQNVASVYHMDYGTSITVPSSEIYELPQEAYHVPPLAIQFCLADMKSTTVLDSSKAQFKDLLVGKQVLIRVVKQETSNPLLQYCEMYYEGRNVKDILVAFNAPLEFTVQPPPRGRDLKVTVSHVESPSIFFIQYNNRLDLIANIQDSVNLYCENRPRLTDTSGLGIGSPVAALFEDNMWYRAMILSISSGTCQISYVDYGNRCEVPNGQMCQISRDLVTKWRTQAVECCLKGFENDSIADMDDEILNKMEETLTLTYYMTPLQFLSTNRLLVELVDELGHKLSDQLIELKSKKSKKPSNPPAASKNYSQPPAPQPAPQEVSEEYNEFPSVHQDEDEEKKRPKDKPKRNQREERPKKTDNLFVRPSIRPIIEQQQSKPERQPRREEWTDKGKSYNEHDDRFDESKNYGRPNNNERPSRFPKNQDNRRGNRNNFNDNVETSESWGNGFDQSSLGNNGFSRPPKGRSTPSEEPPRRGQFRSDEANDNWGSKPRGDRFGGRNSKEPPNDEGWDDQGEKPRWNDKPPRRDDRPPRREGGGGRFNDDWGSKPSEGNNEERKFGGKGGWRRDDDWNKFGGGGGRKFEGGGGRFDGDRKFGGRKRDDGGDFGGGRGDFGGGRRNDGERRGGRFRDGEGGGRREGSRFGNDSRKKFDDFGGSSQTSGFCSKPEISEEWEDSSSATPVVADSAKPVMGTFPLPSVSPKSELQVLLSAISHPHHFYVQRAGCEPELDLVRTMIDNLGQDIKRLKDDSIVPGAPLLAKFSEDGLLYRGTVTLLVPPNQAKVVFVDYGNSEVISYSDLFFMPPDVLNMPPLALNCKLFDIDPINGTWQEDSSIYDPYFPEDEEFTVTVSSAKVVDAELVISGTIKTASGESVSQNLVNAGVAKFAASPFGYEEPVKAPVTGQPKAPATGQPKPPAVEPSIPPAITESVPEEPVHQPVVEPVKEISENWSGRLDLLVNQRMYCEILEAIDERSFVIKLYDAKLVTAATLSEHQASSCIQPGLKAIAEILNITDEKLKITLFDLNGTEKTPFTDAGREVRSVSPICKFPVVRSFDRVVVTHFEEECVYIQRAADVDRLNGFLDETYNVYNESESTGTTWIVGSLCAAKSLLDENWYRGRIVKVGENITVRYLDYGNTEDLPSANIRELVPQFYFPEMALCASLPVAWKSTDQSVMDVIGSDYYYSRISRGPSLMDVIGSDDYYSRISRGPDGWLLDLTSSSGVRLIDKLAEVNLAEESSENPFKVENSTVGSNLGCGDKVPVLVSHADSPSMFWVQLQSHVELVDILQEKLQNVVGGAKIAESSEKVFAANYTADGLWYRATKVSDDTLRFIDYGNTDTLSEAKKIPDDLLKPYSGFAIPVYLCTRPNGDTWSDEAINEFQVFIEHENIVAHVVFAGDKLVVDLLEGERSMSKLLIDSGHGVYHDYINEKVKPYLNESINDSFTERIFPSSLLPISNVEKDIDEVNAKDSSDSIVYVSFSTSLNDFYVQEEVRAPELDAMTDQLSSLEANENIKDVRKNELYAVQFEDGLWYRAKVLSIEPEVVVTFIDFGNTCIASEIRALPQNLKDIKPLALHCSLGIQESAAAYSEFVKLYDHGQTQFTLKIKSEGSPSTVELFKDNVNIISNLCISDESQPKRQKTYITHVYGPDSFFIQTEMLLAQSEDLAVELMDADEFELLEEINEGAIVGALYPEDCCWYRAQVVACAPDIVVRFIDYGNTSIVSELRSLPPELREIEPLALKCSLRLPEQFEIWPGKCTDIFKSLVASNSDKFQVEFISRGALNIVELFLNDEPVTDRVIGQMSDLTEESGVGAQGKGFITHVNTISDFFIQREDCAGLLSQVQTSLSALEENPNEKPSCGKGSLIATRFVDGELYRGEIIQIDPEIRVRFIDYGNECEVSEILALTEELQAIPPVALRCSLDLEGAKVKDDAQAIFEKTCGDGETQIEFTIKSVNNGVSVVEIIVNNKNILDLITDSAEANNVSEGGIEVEVASPVIERDPGLTTTQAKEPELSETIETEVVSQVAEEPEETCGPEQIPEVAETSIVSEQVQQESQLPSESVQISAETKKSNAADKAVEESEKSTTAEEVMAEPEKPNAAEEKISEPVKSTTAEEVMTEPEKPNAAEEKISEPEKSTTAEKVTAEPDKPNAAEEKITELEESNAAEEKISKPAADEKVLDESKNLTSFVSKETVKEPVKTSETITNVVSTKTLEDKSEIIDQKADLEKEEVVESHSSKDEPTGDKDKSPAEETDFPMPTTLPPMKTTKVITSVNSITDFYINVDLPEYVKIEESLRKIDELEDPLSVSQGDLLAARAEDNKWYRCKLLEIFETNFKVILVDCGLISVVQDLKTLPEDIASIKYASIHCSLYKPDSIPEWSEEATVKFKELSEEVIDHEIVDSNSEPYIVKLKTSCGDVSEILAKSCLASSDKKQNSTDNKNKASGSCATDKPVKELKKTEAATSTAKKTAPTRLKTVAEIKATAKSRINSRPTPAPQTQKNVEKLHQPLSIRTSLDDVPVPGALSNPPSPNEK